jgi:hypothetical protein
MVQLPALNSQQTDRPRDPDRPANLWAPGPGDHGAHGRPAGAALALTGLAGLGGARR